MSELPAEIVRAIDEVVLAAGDHRRAANPLGPEFDVYERARDALDATILRHIESGVIVRDLAARVAEIERDAAERRERLRAGLREPTKRFKL